MTSRLLVALVLCVSIGAASAQKQKPVAAVKLAPTPKPPAPSLDPVNSDQVATDRIKDMTMTMRVVHEETNYDELKKISSEFATQYRISVYNFAYKWPNKLRVAGKVGVIGGLIIYNGDTKTYKIGPVKKSESVHGQAGKKQSLMDVGIFAKDWLATDYRAVFLRREGTLLVYKLEQRDSENHSHEIVWVNPKTAITERRISYGWTPTPNKEIRYKNPKEIRPGVFVPTRVEIYNQEGKLGGVQVVEEMKINLGIADDFFEL